MIENVNASKTSSNVEYDIKKYIGVASVNVLAVNPSNAVLRQYGWSIPEGTEEPEYTGTVERNGKQIKSGRIRFLVQLVDFDAKPVIALDFWVRATYKTNKEGGKFQVLDQFGRTAWVTKEEFKKKYIPKFDSGEEKIALPYTVAHEGEEELVKFIMKYLNVTPVEVYDRTQQKYVKSKNPGKMTIDNWDSLCNGNAAEIKGYLNMQPENRVKVILGIRESAENNRTYQTFLNTDYISNGSKQDPSTGEYKVARKAIDKFMSYGERGNYRFEATPVREFKEIPTEVKDNSVNDLPSDFDDMAAPMGDLPNIDELPM